MSKNGKRSISIALIMLQFICLTAILCAFGAAMPAISIFYKNQLKSDAEDLVHTAYGVEQTINEWVVTLTGETKLLAMHPKLIANVSNTAQPQIINTFLQFTASTLDMDYLAFVGTDGKVVYGYNIAAGQNVGSSAVVAEALKGQSVHSYESIGDIPYGMFFAAPVKDDDKLLGVLLAGYSMIDGMLVDLIQESHNVDCTIFKEDTRLSTTLHGANGQSLVGTKLDNQKIINGVLKNGGQYRGYNTIAGVEYSTVYMPLKSGDGKITGMVFVAKSLIPAQKVKMNTVSLASIIAILLTVPFSCGGLLFTKWLIKRISYVTNFLITLASGNADLTKRVRKKRNDEIGDLVDAFNAFADKMQNIVKDIKISKNNLNISGEKMDGSAKDTFEQVT
ncbi:MAG: cache domain-containing protein, partial [Spirochaetales bacterium]|nr:cache domain-containing protein [Spirochaetales bacterium]